MSRNRGLSSSRARWPAPKQRVARQCLPSAPSPAAGHCPGCQALKAKSGCWQHWGCNHWDLDAGDATGINWSPRRSLPACLPRNPCEVWIYNICDSLHPSTRLHSPAGAFIELFFSNVYLPSSAEIQHLLSARSQFLHSSTAGLGAEGAKWLAQVQNVGQGLWGDSSPGCSQLSPHFL